jgi:hypothetical protein
MARAVAVEAAHHAVDLGRRAADRAMGEETGVMLAISLHAVTDELRDVLVPINKKYPLKNCSTPAGPIRAVECRAHHLRIRHAEGRQRQPPTPRNWCGC